jgi:hypothetical protein
VQLDELPRERQAEPGALDLPGTFNISASGYATTVSLP